MWGNELHQYLFLDRDSFREDEVVVIMAENRSTASDKMIEYLMEKEGYDEDEAKDVFCDCYTELTIRKILK